CIAWADRGDRVSRLQAAFEIADMAIIFDAVDRKSGRRKLQQAESRGGKLPLKCDIVDGDDSHGALALAIAQIDGGHGGLPVMRMDDFRGEIRYVARSDLGCDEAQSCKAFG